MEVLKGEDSEFKGVVRIDPSEQERRREAREKRTKDRKYDGVAMFNGAITDDGGSAPS